MFCLVCPNRVEKLEFAFRIQTHSESIDLGEVRLLIDHRRIIASARVMEKYPLKGGKSIALNQLVGNGGGGSGNTNVGSAIDGGKSYQSVTRKVCAQIPTDNS